jgi:predicted dehydrogenase
MTFTAAIVGLGKIGMRYDQHLSAPAYVLSHARAFAEHPDFLIAGAADPDPLRREEFSRTFGASAYPTAGELMAAVKPDVLVIASPTASHAESLREALDNHTPRVVLCEKPLAYSSVETRAIIDACDRRGIPLLVNFIRRADPGIMEVATRIENGKIATPFKAAVWYSKGLLHNGSHMVDLMRFWFGPVRGIRLVQSGRALPQGDAEPDFQVTFDHGSAIFCAAWEEHFSHYTLDLVTSSGRLCYEQGGELFWRSTETHPAMDGYRRLAPQPEIIGNDMNRYQYHVTEQLGRMLRGASCTLCTGAEAAATGEWLDRVLRERGAE